MLELMGMELDALIGCVKNVNGYDTEELDLLRDTFAAFKVRAEYYMNRWDHHVTMCRGFAQLANTANRFYDEL